ncbi:MAG TPA: hypothetical protein VFL92_09460, partial [Sphingomonas sp.]|nr:hypothetical protein [Sphingomonas sp.]
NYVGRAMTLYRDPEVQFGGMKVGGIRISHMSHIDGEQSMALTATRAQRRLFKVRPLRIEQEQQDSGQRRQSPADWTAEFIEKMKAAPDLDALAEIQRKAERPIAKLKADHPDLHKRAADAAAARDRELRPNDGTLSAENPAASEGRADRDMGDAFADDPFASEEM